MSESLCFKHKKHHVYIESECPWCQIDRLKAGLKSSELSRATLSGLYHDLQCQLAEARTEVERFKHMAQQNSTEMCEWMEKYNQARQQVMKEVE